MIAYAFPPEGSAGVYRPLRFVRHLPEQSWHPVVLAADVRLYQRFDPDLLGEVPSGVDVVRVANPDPWLALKENRTARIRQERRRSAGGATHHVPTVEGRSWKVVLRRVADSVEAMVYCPDPAMFWIWPGTREGIRTCRRSGADVIWATGAPWSSFVVAQRISRRTGLPYVLDFRDSWTLTHNEFQMRQPLWARNRNKRLLARLFREAHAIVFRYMSEAESYWRMYPGSFEPENVHLIPNGYDGPIAAFDPPKGEHCTVAYTGMVGGYLFDGLIEALSLLRRTDSATASRLRFIFVGEGVEEVAECAAAHGVADLIETSRSIPFREVTALQAKSHALLLLGWKPARGNELGGSSKVFGYMKAGRPILGVLPGDENRRVLRSVGVQTMAPADSPVEIADLLRRMVSGWSSGTLKELLPDPRACEEFSADHQTEALVRALEGREALHPFIPGASSVPPSLERLLGTEDAVLGAASAGD